MRCSVGGGFSTAGCLSIGNAPRGADAAQPLPTYRWHELDPCLGPDERKFEYRLCARVHVPHLRSGGRDKIFRPLCFVAPDLEQKRRDLPRLSPYPCLPQTHSCAKSFQSWAVHEVMMEAIPADKECSIDITALPMAAQVNCGQRCKMPGSSWKTGWTRT